MLHSVVSERFISVFSAVFSCVQMCGGAWDTCLWINRLAQCPPLPASSAALFSVPVAWEPVFPAGVMGISVTRCLSAQAAITKHQRPSGLNKSIASQFWILEVQDHGVARTGFS